MAEEDIAKTAVTTKTFQRFIDSVVRGLAFLYACIDDMLDASPDTETQRALFTRLQDHAIVINVAKSESGVKKLNFLRHHLNQHDILPLPSKVAAIHDFPQPS
ncbi:uncharacterized protein LOC135370515 [Ornithodoros turicata]|uniref:uncharacterized protein LOC135370515 n=1 Tax=Ornithodoros turicata TaxID=34597 RepID=UPI00313A0305